MSKRSRTWPKRVYAPAAPPTNSSPPTTSHPGRSVATYSITRKMPKNSRLEPRSRWKTRMPSETSHIARIGPRSRPRGRSTNRKRRPGGARGARGRARGAAAGEREGVAVQDEVAGEGDDQQHLGDLAGLEAHGSEVDPDAGTVDAPAD